MLRTLCVVALASYAVCLVDSLPRFDDDDIYMEDFLQDLAPRSKKSPAIAAASAAKTPNNSPAGGSDPIKTTAKDDPKDIKIFKGLRSKLENLESSLIPSKSTNSGEASEAVASREGEGAPRTTRQHIPAAALQESMLTRVYPPDPYFPSARTFGAAGITREPQSEVVHPGEGAQAGHGAHGEHGRPLKQLKQLIPNLISALTNILPPAPPSAGPAHVTAPPHLRPPSPTHVTLPPAPHLSQTSSYGLKPGIIYNKQIILAPGGGSPHRGLGGQSYDNRLLPATLNPELFGYAARYPVYPEVPGTYGYTYNLNPQVPQDQIVNPSLPAMFVDSAGRSWVYPMAQPFGYDRGLPVIPEFSVTNNNSELAARSAMGPPVTEDELRAAIEREQKRISFMEEQLRTSGATLDGDADKHLNVTST